MPFVGAINQDLRAIVSEASRAWGASRVYVGCSGNFTIERILAGRGFELHSNDISLYSCAIGSTLAGNPLAVTLHDPAYAWLQDSVEPGYDLIATLLLCTTMLQGYGKDENPYYRRMNAAYRAAWPELHGKTVEKVKRALAGLHLAAFHAGDVVEWLRTTPRGEAVISFPLTYEREYERLYKAFGALFAWDEPDYQVFDDARMVEMAELMTEHHCWMLARDVPVEWLAEHQVGYVQNTARNKPLYVYASASPLRIALPQQRIDQLPWPRINEGTEITERSTLAILPIAAGQFDLLRADFLNPSIAPAQPQIKLAVLIDGTIIGAMGFSISQRLTFCDIYMMTDLGLRPSRYPRLSKLVLAAALSREVRLLCERMVNSRVSTIGTAAFTDNPVSMKYRGIFDLHDRKPGLLTYTGRAGKWPLRDALAWWLKHHASTNSTPVSLTA
ncbi:MAG: putative antirestriction adenine methyltransferase [Solirubrobacteraceae bacterium]